MTFSHLMYGSITVPQVLELLLRILAACLCGAAIGLERTSRFKEAGIRTHCVITCAAAALTIVSKYGFLDLAASGMDFYGLDPARVAAQIVSGVGFLGAGIIFKHGYTIRGLTSAAGIWASAAIGIILGAGMYIVGVFVTVLTLAVLIGVRHFNLDNEGSANIRLCARVQKQGNQKQELLDALTAKQLDILEAQITDEGEYLSLELTVRGKTRLQTAQLLDMMEILPGVTSISS